MSKYRSTPNSTIRRGGVARTDSLYARKRNAGPSWGIVLIAAVVALVLIWLSNYYGLWFVTPVITFAVGILSIRGWRAFSASWIAGIGGWGLPLVWQSFVQHLPVGQTAQDVSLAMSFGKDGTLVIFITLLLGFLLATVGAWLGWALIRLIRPS